MPTRDCLQHRQAGLQYMCVESILARDLSRFRGGSGQPNPPEPEALASLMQLKRKTCARVLRIRQTVQLFDEQLGGRAVSLSPGARLAHCPFPPTLQDPRACKQSRDIECSTFEQFRYATHRTRRVFPGACWRTGRYLAIARPRYPIQYRPNRSRGHSRRMACAAASLESPRGRHHGARAAS